MGAIGWLQKRVKASSLTEVLTASVIMMIVFGIAVTVLGTLIESLVNKNTQYIENELNEIHYLLEHQQIKIPFEEEMKDWNVTVEKESDSDFIIIQAVHLKTKKKVYRKIISYEKF